jgi:hypothetical protein
MKGKLVRVSLVLLSLVLLVSTGALAAAPVGLGQDDPGNGLVSSRSDPTWEPLATREWTSERMQNAKPYPLPAIEARPQAESVGPVEEAVGVPGLIPGGPAETEYSLPDVLASIETFPADTSSAVPLGYPYPPPFTRYENFDKYTKYPYRTVGVLFFTQNGIDYRCSASSIGNYAIWTAGHCVSDGAGNWSTNFLFIPAYRDGNPPAWWAQWTGANAWTTTAWHYNSELCRDIGGVVLNLSANGRKVSYVGWLGFAWNFPRDQHWFEIGYPAGAPFNGNRMIICASSHSSDDNPGCPAGSPNTIGAGCDQTGGCSGGPWIKNFAGVSGATNFLNGNFSYHYIGFESEKYSPYFDDMAYGLWDILVNEVP